MQNNFTLYDLRYKAQVSANVIRYPLREDNFDQAEEALRSRYKNKHILVVKQVKTYMKLLAMQSENNEQI